MMFQWLARRRAVQAAAEMTAVELIEAFGAKKAWHAVRHRRREVPIEDAEQERHLAEVTRAIERLTEYTYQPDTATRYLEP